MIRCAGNSVFLSDVSYWLVIILWLNDSGNGEEIFVQTFCFLYQSEYRERAMDCVNAG